MKRSELEKILLEDLREQRYINESDQYGHLIVKYILNFLEDKVGMKPPHHPGRRGSAWCNHTNWDDGVYEWEEENE